MGETIITHENSRDKSVCGVFCKNEPEVSFEAFGYTFHWCRDCYNEPCTRCREEIPESARGSTRAKGWCEDCREEIGLLVGDDDRGIQKETKSNQTKLMTDGGRQMSHPGDIEARDTPLGSVISDRPEVRDLTIHYGDGRVIVLVTFEGWGMPNGFAHDYDMDLMSAYVHDDRPLWKRVLNIGPPGRLVGHFIRARESVPLGHGGVDDA